MKELTFQIKRYSTMYWYRLFRILRLRKLKFKFILWWYKGNEEKYCWTDCVSWAFSPSRWNPYKIDGTKACYLDSMDATQHEACYCGAWFHGIYGAKLSKQEVQEKLDELMPKATDELPF